MYTWSYTYILHLQKLIWITHVMHRVTGRAVASCPSSMAAHICANIAYTRRNETEFLWRLFPATERRGQPEFQTQLMLFSCMQKRRF